MRSTGGLAGAHTNRHHMQGRIARADLEEGQQDLDAVFPHMSHDISAEILVGLAEQAGHLTVHGHGAQRVCQAPAGQTDRGVPRPV